MNFSYGACGVHIADFMKSSMKDSLRKGYTIDFSCI